MSVSIYLKGLAFTLLALITVPASAQVTVSGTVTDTEYGEPLIGVNVVEKGTTNGAATDIDGKYTLDVANESSVLVFSYIGFNTVEETVGSRRTIDVQMTSGQLLNEVVVVGYGTAQSKDLTGSVTAINEEDFLKGNISTPEQLVSGKIAGVNITSNGGAPGSGSRIRIRGGTSLNASNDPLIVIDGVPVDNTGIAGSANALNMINPAEIESITVLKDASAAAIYGSRAANGVILITTKKGKAGQDLSLSFSTTNSISQNPSNVDVLNADEFRQLVNDKLTEAFNDGSSDTTSIKRQVGLLGDANTDWQDEIYRMGFSTQNNLTFTGGIKNLPYRLNLEYYQNKGVLKRSRMDRYGLNVSLTPSLFDDQLQVEANAKYSHTDNFFADQGAIGSAVTFDPTQEVMQEDAYFQVIPNPDNPGQMDTIYNDYFEWLNNAGRPNPLAPRNPVGLLNQKDDESDVNRFLGNLKLDYALPFVDGLHAILNLGMDRSRSNGFVYIPPEAGSSYDRKGVNNVYEQSKDNRLLELYGNYKRELTGLDSRIDVTAGYSYQNWLTKSPAQPDMSALGDTVTPPGIPFETENTLISFYGRLNYNMSEKYLLTATLRNDGSSRFSPDTRWGLFPSLALAWRLSEEGFFPSGRTTAKLRLGWGVTGQQDIGNDYPYIPNYDQSTSTAQYQFGDKFFSFLRPDGYDANIKWEETMSYNVGLDLGFMNNQVNATIDWYKKITDDLLAVIPVPAGTNFTNQILTNVGSLENTGLEVTLNYIAIDKRDTRLEIGGNVTFNKNEITGLTKTEDRDDPGIQVGGIPGGIGNTIQLHTVDHPAFSYLVYQQQYDENGNPIEDEYADLNGDSVITPGRADLGAGDQYIFDGNPEPSVYAGLYASFTHKKWSVGFSLRGAFGHYIYNGVNAQRGFYRAIDPQSGQYLNNLNPSYFESEFEDGEVTQFLSDYYLEKGDYIRLDNFTVGYDLGNVTESIYLRLSAAVQNGFVISGYSGLDPELAGGIDNNIYPRPRIYSINLSVTL